MDYKKRLKLNETFEFINMVTDYVIDIDETGRVFYYPELQDFAFRLAVAKFYGGYQPLGDIDSDYEVAMDVDITTLPLDRNQLAGIKEAIDRDIAEKKNTLTNDLATLLKLIADKVSAINTEEINSKIAQLTPGNLVKEYLKAGK